MKNVITIIVCLLILWSAKAAEIGSGGVYSVVELSFSGPNQTPSNTPAKDIDFWVQFRHESGSPTYKIYGFWDGDGNGATSGSVFKVRFCPTQTGKWTLLDVYSNNSLLNNQKEGDYVTAVTSSNKGFWIIDANSEGGRWFMRSNGEHQFIVGNTHYDFLAAPNGHETNSTEIRTDIDENAKQFNKLRFQIAATNSKNNTGTLRTFFDVSGNQTFAETDKPNPKYFTERVDAAVKRGFEKDLICDLILGGPDQKLTSDAYLKYIVARYGAYQNVWFCLNNEWNEVSSASAEKAWGVKLRNLMAYPNPASTHATRGWDSGLNGTWCTHSICQGKLPSHLSDMYKCADAIVTDYNAIGGNKPGINDENGYDPNESTEQDVIEGIVGSFAGGGYGSTGHKTGDKAGGYFWGYTSQGWTVATHPSSDNLGWMKNIINNNISFWKMKPIKPQSGNFFANANANFRGLEWTGQQYVLVSDAAQSNISVTLPSGSWNIYQYNVITKSESSLGTNKSGTFQFSTPSSRACMTFFKNVGPVVIPPVAPVLAAPANNTETTNQKPQFSWNVVSYNEGIKKYEISINNTIYDAGTASTYTPTSNITFGQVQWKVRAIGNNNLNGDWSEARILTIVSNSTLIISPASGSTLYPLQEVTATGTGINLSWVVSVTGGVQLKTGTSSSITFNVPINLTNGNSITIKLTGDGGTVTNIYNIIDKLPVVTTQSVDLGIGTVGVSYNDDIEAADGDAPYTWSGANIPQGLAIQTTGGNLVGIPTQAGTFTFTVTVTDADGDTNSKTLSITVNENQNNLTVDASADVQSGTAPLSVQFTAQASGGNTSSGTDAFIEAGGSVVMEAENFDSQVSNGDVLSWSIATGISGFKGTGYVTTPNSGIANASFANAATLKYNVNFVTAGTYYVWVLRNQPDGASNSAYIGYNNTIVGSSIDNGGGTGWVWVKNGTTINVAAGAQTIELRRREDGYSVDRIVLTTSSTTPTSSMLESSRTGGVTYTYNWNFGDGNTSTIQNPAHVYNTAGIYNAILSVTDGSQSAKDTVVITVTTSVTYTLTVNNGSGNGTYAAGAVATITANAAPAGKVFDKWTGDVSGIANINSATTSITMPAANTTISATYKDVVIPEELIINVSAKGVKATNLQVGSIYYTDRTFTIKSLPSNLVGAEFIKTANNDKGNTSESYLTFTLTAEAYIAIAYDSRATAVPNWMSTWDKTTDVITTTDVTLNVYQKLLPAGTYTLGGNKAAGAIGAGSNYFVVSYFVASPKSGNMASSIDDKKMNLSIYPIPASNQLTLFSNKEIQTLTMVSVSGCVVLKRKLVEPKLIQFDIESLQSGFYILTVEYADGSNEQRSFIKQ